MDCVFLIDRAGRLFVTKIGGIIRKNYEYGYEYKQHRIVSEWLYETTTGYLYRRELSWEGISVKK